MSAFIPEPHILLIVVAGTEFGMPAPNAACRAGAWPRFAGSTQPMITSCTSLAASPESLSAAAIAIAAELDGGRGAQGAQKRADRRTPGGENDYG